jgi:molybdopterin converting factor subunit 1
MRVTVQYYARLRELAGRAEWTAEVADTATIADVWRACLAAHPPVVQLDGRVSAARNAEFTRFDARVAEGDEIAFLPPVSGGSGTES